MRDPIENVTRLQKQLNNLQLENQVLKNILDKAGLSYQNELASIRKTDTKEDFDPESCERFAVIDQEVVWYGNILIFWARIRLMTVL